MTMRKWAFAICCIIAYPLVLNGIMFVHAVHQLRQVP